MKIPGPGEWTFENSDIASNFDEHVREQLPWYDLATGAIAHICRHYLPVNGVLYDIGASTGNLSRVLGAIIEKRNVKVVALEPSAEMAKQYSGKGALVQERAEDHDFEHFDVAVMFLTMMFVDINKRHELLYKLREKCRLGGAIIIFDKTIAKSGYFATVMSRLTLAGKVATGVNPVEIIKKELSLSGIQRPFNPSIIGGAEEFFRYGEFSGWIIPNDKYT